MGKVKRLRQKFHNAVKSERTNQQSSLSTMNISETTEAPLTQPSDTLFSGFNIDVSSLKTKLNDDVQSVKSFKSTKSEKSKQNGVSKKDKLKIRRQVLMKKIDTINQMKKELKVREKRKKTAIIGDTNQLHDALPSLESLLKSRPNIKVNIPGSKKKKKGIENARKRKKEMIQGVKIFNSVLNNKNFKKNPLESITRHVQAIVEHERRNMKS